jgi:hypothetical protein
MVTTLDYAIMAGRSYFDTRAAINRFPIPDGWTLDFRIPEDKTTGFEGAVFRKSATNEIVISYSGTDPNNSNPLTTPDGKTNTALAGGGWAEQLLQAAQYYLDIKAANPNATITLTGHSLGGGLAALVAVFFDVHAQTFDQAPFTNSALSTANGDNAQLLRDRLAGSGSTYQSGIEKLDAYLQLRNASTSRSYIPRQERVDTIRVEGEFLDGGFLGNKSFGNPSTSIQHGPAEWTLASFDLHSQALLTAFLQSQKTATPSNTLNEVSKSLPPLLRMLFDKNLFTFNAASADTNHEPSLQGATHA